MAQSLFLPIAEVAMDDMISGIIAMKQADLSSKIDIAVARKVLDNQQMQGAAAVKLIQAATQGVNKAGDQLVAAATGLGGSIDTYG